MFRRIGLAFALFGALLPFRCDRPRELQARPALWRVADADTTIWLLGSIHLLPPEVRWRTARVERAIDDADALVLEIPIDDPGAQSGAFDRLARADRLPPILERVPADKRAALTAAAAQAGMSIDELDGMKSWAAATALASGSSRKQGATRADGVEMVLARAFADKRKPRLAFESFTGQLALFDTLPEAAQRQLLVRTLDEAATPRADYQATLIAWRTGDTTAIANDFNATFAGAPLLEETLLTGRNRRWSNWIARRMERPGTVLVAVGAGHLAGPQSVVALLARRGLHVERVE